MTSLLHLLLAIAAGWLALVRKLAAARLPGARATPHPVAELRRLWRKEAAWAGLDIAAWAPGAAFGCDAAALLLVPTVPAGLPEPFGDLLVVFGLLAAGRLLSTLAAFEGGGSGATASRAALVLAASGPGAVLIVAVVGGAGGSAGVLPAWSGLRDLAGPVLPAGLAGLAACVLGWADLTAAPDPDGIASGPALAALRLSAAARCAAWLDLAATLLPPAAPDVVWQSVAFWAVKFAVLLAALTLAEHRTGPQRPVAAPALAALFGLLGAVLLALRAGAA